ncbi:serine/threonine protein kinase [Streptomyces hoynatensis]|uniref:non-specific serine/threonine protein kinase n=2 Tax=Streptomyces hoynatensis TaxID=1141874 RepID=A0A3A9YY22_9ACTN|nr:serine/threonine protein kinase [Streptomyces hoynatensis]
MGTVYLSHTRGGQPVALKLIRRDLGRDDTFRRRFAQEVTAARRVKGYHLLQVVDHDISGERPWLATEFVAGLPLHDALAEHGPLPLPAALRLTGCAARALQSIHAAGVVHRDLKPSNLMLTESGPHVIDFGIARAADATQLTTSNGFIGTPHYMSPEHALGQPVGPAGDVFALGLIAAVAATGRHPYGEGGGLTVATLIAGTEQRPPDLSGYPEPLREVLTRTLAADPGRRIAPAELAALCERLAGEPLDDLRDWLPAPVTASIRTRAAEIRTPPPPQAPAFGGTTQGSAAFPGTTGAPAPPPPPTYRATAPGERPAPAPAAPAPSGPPRRGRLPLALGAAGAGALAVLLLNLLPLGGDGDNEAEGGGSSAGSATDPATTPGRPEEDTTSPPPTEAETAQEPEPEPYTLLIEAQPFELRTDDYTDVGVDYDEPFAGTDVDDYDALELYLGDSLKERWEFQTATGLASGPTAQECELGSRTNVLPESLDYADFEDTLPVGSLLCTTTSEGNIALLEVTALTPVDDRYDVSTLLTVWEPARP